MIRIGSGVMFHRMHTRTMRGRIFENSLLVPLGFAWRLRLMVCQCMSDLVTVTLIRELLQPLGFEALYSKTMHRTDGQAQNQ